MKFLRKEGNNYVFGRIKVKEFILDEDEYNTLKAKREARLERLQEHKTKVENEIKELQEEISTLI